MARRRCGDAPAEWTDLTGRDRDLHGEHNDRLTRLRLLANPQVVQAAEDLHVADDEVTTTSGGLQLLVRPKGVALEMLRRGVVPLWLHLPEDTRGEADGGSGLPALIGTPMGFEKVLEDGRVQRVPVTAGVKHLRSGRWDGWLVLAEERLDECRLADPPRGELVTPARRRQWRGEARLRRCQREAMKPVEIQVPAESGESEAGPATQDAPGAISEGAPTAPGDAQPHGEVDAHPQGEVEGRTGEAEGPSQLHGQRPQDASRVVSCEVDSGIQPPVIDLEPRPVPKATNSISLPGWWARVRARLQGHR
jgi:hypothetical protein